MKETCGATSKRSGQRCRKWPTRGRSTCRLHGGSLRQPIGPEHPGWRHGLYGRHAPPDLQAPIDAAATDPRLHDAGADLELLTALVVARLDRMGRRRLTADDEASLLKLIDARGRLLARLEREADRERIMRFARVIAASVRKHVTDPVSLRGLLVDLRVAQQGGGNEKTD